MDRFSGKAWISTVCGLALIGCSSTPPKTSPESSSSASTAKAVTTPPEKMAPVATPEKAVAPAPASAPKQVAAPQESTPVETKPVETKAAPAPAPMAAPPPAAPKAEAPVAAKPMAPAPAAAPAALKLPKDPHTYLITAGPKDNRHPFFGSGHTLGFMLNGEPGKSVVIERGQTYTFQVDTGVQHDFYFSTAPIGWGGGTYSEGVAGQFTYQGDVTLTPSTTTPDTLYYACRNHKYMGGKIYVVNKGEAGKVQMTKDTVTDEAAVVKVSEAQVKQKLAYAEMLAGSAAAKRVAASSNAQAKDLLTQAKSQIDQAKALLAKSDAAGAQNAVNESLKLINSATVMVPADGASIDYKARYDELHKEITGYITSFEKNVKAGQGKQAASTFNRAKFDAAVKEGESLAGKGDYQAANKELTHAATQITAVLSLMLQNATVVYDKSFSTPKEEFEYEVARYESFKELVPLAIEQRNLGDAQKQMLDEAVKKAERIVGEGKGFADRGDYTTAIQAYQAATENIELGLKRVGVQ